MINLVDDAMDCAMDGHESLSLKLFTEIWRQSTKDKWQSYCEYAADFGVVIQVGAENKPTRIEY